MAQVISINGGTPREDLDWWAEELGGEIRDGHFGENLTTRGIDVNESEVGERWRIGTALFEVAMVRIPCNDFKNWQRLNGFDDRAWVKRFAARARPGAYLRVLQEGEDPRNSTMPIDSLDLDRDSSSS